MIVLSVVSELTASSLPSGLLGISGGFLAITLAAVLLGGTPAAIVGTVTIALAGYAGAVPATLPPKPRRFHLGSRC